METIANLTAPHQLPDGTYECVWSGSTIYIERPMVELTTLAGMRGRRAGKVIVEGTDRQSVRFEEVDQ
ncbi:MAG TPA: hypothetical protein VJU58_13735 [Microbacterium sp.]|nr:hypothetical protein [Microbacterium sp.]